MGEKMGRNKTRREQAKLLFIHSNYSGKEIADTFGVSENTISKWRKDDNWDEAKVMQTTAPEDILKFLFNQINAIKNSASNDDGTTRLLSNNEVDSLLKLSKAVQEIRGEKAPQTIMEVLNEFMIYLKSVDINLAKKIVDHIGEYVELCKKVNI